MPSRLWEFDKFWVIWCSCLDQCRTLKQIQRIWGYKGNALYQKGERLPLWKEMVEKGVLEERGVIKKRGVSGKLLYGKMGWVENYLSELLTTLKYENNNPLPFDLMECFSDKTLLVKYLEENRRNFFSIENLKTLFGNKENLKNYGNLALFSPIASILLVSFTSFLSSEGLSEDVLSLVFQPLIFQPNFCVNFLGYFQNVTKSLKPETVPTGLVSKKRLFRVLRKYSFVVKV